MQSLPISLSLADLSGAAALAEGGPREQIVAAATLGYRAIQLDATAEGIRPRQLDRSARRDLAALLRRVGLELSGLDLFIPPDHLSDMAKSDRAVSAIEQAITLAGELRSLGGEGGCPVCLTLPAVVPAATLQHLAAHAVAHGTLLADHAWPPRTPSTDGIGVGVDPPMLIASGAQILPSISKLGGPPVSARLSDLGAFGRTAPGRGSLDRNEYEAALVTAGYSRHVVLDLREVKEARSVAVEFAPA